MYTQNSRENENGVNRRVKKKTVNKILINYDFSS